MLPRTLRRRGSRTALYCSVRYAERRDSQRSTGVYGPSSVRVRARARNTPTRSPVPQPQMRGEQWRCGGPCQHHCRQCGRVVCAGCSDHFIPIPAAPNRNSRVCDDCFAASIRNSVRKKLQANVDCTQTLIRRSHRAFARAALNIPDERAPGRGCRAGVGVAALRFRACTVRWTSLRGASCMVV